MSLHTNFIVVPIFMSRLNNLLDNFVFYFRNKTYSTNKMAMQNQEWDVFSSHRVTWNTVSIRVFQMVFSLVFFLAVPLNTMTGRFGFASATDGPIVAIFRVSNDHSRAGLQHLVVDKHSGLVYVGGVNRLYQLSPELDRQVTVETGPREDSPDCPAVDCLGSVVKRPTDNINKALVIDYTDARIIACGTLHQGIIKTEMYSMH